MTCTVEGCDRKPRARGLCSTHWKRWRRDGTPGTEPIDTARAHQKITDRYPVADLLAAAGVPIRQLELDAGFQQGFLWHVTERGGFNWRQADEWACRIGLHPSLVWGDLWWTSTPGWADSGQVAA